MKRYVRGGGWIPLVIIFLMMPVYVYFTQRSKKVHPDPFVGPELAEISRRDSIAGLRSSIVSYAKTLHGTPYEFAGCKPGGFDCSGFVFHVYDVHRIKLPRSSILMSDSGTVVPLEQSIPSDLIFFKGTDLDDPNVGHVGIIISQPGDSVRFIHSSSNGGVKITSFYESAYPKRFLFVKRFIK